MATKDTDKEIQEIPTRIKAIKAQPLPALKRQQFLSVIATFILLLAACVGAYAFFPSPRGKITSPKAGATTGRSVEIAGFTKNLPVNHKYIRVTVEVPYLQRAGPAAGRIQAGQT